MSDRKKKIIMPERGPKISASSVMLVPSVENLLSDALSTIGNELARLSRKSINPNGLPRDEARILQGYIKSLVDLSKEAREREKNVDLTDYSDDEIVEHMLLDMEQDDVQKLFRKIMRKNELEEEQDVVSNDPEQNKTEE